MAINLPETMILFDRDDSTTIKVVGAFNTATTSNTTVVAANTLAFANASRQCVLSVLSVQADTSFANGYVSLYYVGNGANTNILNFGRATSHLMEGYMTNPWAANTASATFAGDIGVNVVGASSGDCYSLIFKVRKEAQGGGYANAYIAYNDSSFTP